MSLLSSFIIDPVVRHARRFSGQRLGEASSDEARTLACDNEGSASLAATSQPPRDTDTNAATPRDGNASRSIAERRPVLADRSRRHSSFTFPPSVGVAEEEEDEQQHDDAPLKPDKSIPIDHPIDMPSDPSHPLPIRSRHSEAPSNAVASTLIPSAGQTNGQDAGATSEALPADDGMAALRMRVHEIRDLKISDHDRARMMHALMMERYNVLRPTSPSSFISQDRPFTPTSGQSIFSEVHASSPYSAASDIDPDNPYNLRTGDTNPTYRSRPQQNSPDHGEDEEDETADGELIFGCHHYKRNVKVQCFECRRWHTCRHCHDAVEDHNLNRKMTQHMLCMACGTPQKAAEYCKNCELQAACYYCDICKLWDNNSKKKIYHCLDCGICRRGEGIGKDFHHCKVLSSLKMHSISLKTTRNAMFA